MKTEEEIKQRINELRDIKKTVRSSPSKSRYNCLINELKWIISK